MASSCDREGSSRRSSQALCIRLRFSPEFMSTKLHVALGLHSLIKYDLNNAYPKPELEARVLTYIKVRNDLLRCLVPLLLFKYGGKINGHRARAAS